PLIVIRMPLSPREIALSIAAIWVCVSPSVLPAATVRSTLFWPAAVLASFSIETKYGLDSVFRISATPTFFPPPPPPLPPALLLEFDDDEHAERASAAAATPAVTPPSLISRARRRARLVLCTSSMLWRPLCLGNRSENRGLDNVVSRVIVRSAQCVKTSDVHEVVTTR